MLDDYSARVSEGIVWAIEDAKTIVGILVLLPKPDHLLLDNIAVSPSHQGRGSGGACSNSPKQRHCGAAIQEIRLYTPETMTENQRLDAAIGYKETGRGNEAEYERVFMRKRLAGRPVEAEETFMRDLAYFSPKVEKSRV